MSPRQRARLAPRPEGADAEVTCAGCGGPLTDALGLESGYCSGDCFEESAFDGFDDDDFENDNAGFDLPWED